MATRPTPDRRKLRHIKTTRRAPSRARAVGVAAAAFCAALFVLPGSGLSAAGDLRDVSKDGKCVSKDQGVDCVFAQRNREQTFVIPSGVGSLVVRAVGAPGGDGGRSGGGDGGSSAVVEATYAIGPTHPLKPGQTLYLRVGGDGDDGGRLLGGDGGFNGGADGGRAKGLSFAGGGGGGGGASDVRTISSGRRNSLSSRLLVAAGGGGGGGGHENGTGGSGGSASQNGQNGANSQAGNAGTETAGGTGGSARGRGSDGSAGSLAQGGKGGNGPSGGGGGAGGLYGGGGSAGSASANKEGAGGGGGGSNRVPVSGTATLDTSGKARVELSYRPATHAFSDGTLEPFPVFSLRTLVPSGNTAGCTAITIGPNQVGAAPAPYANPTCVPGDLSIHALALNLSTLALSTPTANANVSFLGFDGLRTWVESRTSSDLVIIEVPKQLGGIADLTDFNAAANRLGAPGFQLNAIPSGGVNLVVAGVPGWPAGSGFQNGSPNMPSGLPLEAFLVHDQNDKYAIVPGPTLSYDTESGTLSSPAMAIAGRTYAMGACQDPGTVGQGCGQNDPYFHVVVVQANDPAVTLDEHTFMVDSIDCAPTPSGEDCTYLDELNRMVETLAGLVGDPSKLVFVQSVGAPYHVPDDPSLYAQGAWELIGNLLGGVGGTEHVWNTSPTSPPSDGSGAYALVGGQAVVDAKLIDGSGSETSPRIPDAWSGDAGPASLSGQLVPDHHGWYTPAAAKFDDAPTLNEIAFQAPEPWPKMDTPNRLAAYAWINGPSVLNFTKGIRTAYYDNENVAWSDELGDLEGAPYPGDGHTYCKANGEPYSGAQKDPPVPVPFSAQDYCDVNGELQTEVAWISPITTYFGKLAEPFTITKDETVVDVATVAKAIEATVEPPPSSPVATDMLYIFSTVIGVLSGGATDPEMQIALTAFSSGLSTAALFTSGGDGDPVTAAVDVEAQNLSTTLSANVDATLDQLGRLQDIVVADYGKMSLVGTNVGSSGPWPWNRDVHNEAVQRLTVSTQRTAFAALLPVAGFVSSIHPTMEWHENNHPATNLQDLRCFSNVPPFPSIYGPIPASSWVRLQLWPESYPDNLAQQTATPPWRFLVLRLLSDVTFLGTSPPATLTDPLFKPSAPAGVYTGGGMGFFAPWFYGRAFTPQEFICN